MKCPDCNGPIAIDATKCRCGWAASSSPARTEVAGRVSCDTEGCGAWAFIKEKNKNLCQRCWEGQLNAEAYAHCKDKGLNTVADMRAYCSRLLRSGVFTAPSFERWAENLQQPAIDRMAMMNGKSDKQVLLRLRGLGVIDAQNKIIPVDARAAARNAHEAEVRAERERAEAILKDQGVIAADVLRQESKPA